MRTAILLALLLVLLVIVESRDLKRNSRQKNDARNKRVATKHKPPKKNQENTLERNFFAQEDDGYNKYGGYNQHREWDYDTRLKPISICLFPSLDSGCSSSLNCIHTHAGVCQNNLDSSSTLVFVNDTMATFNFYPSPDCNNDVNSAATVSVPLDVCTSYTFNSQTVSLRVLTHHGAYFY